MTATNDHAVHVLNNLIETTLDSADGYREAAENAHNPSFKTLFQKRAAERARLSSELKSEVRSFGGEPEDDTSILAKTHRAFANLKTAVAGNSDKAVIDEVEHGEDVIKARFEKAIGDAELPASALQMVQRAYILIKADHDEVSALKHALH